MAVKIRLMRIGAKGRPFYRIVAVDGRRKRTGGYIELLGTYNPLTNPKEIILKQDRIDEWVKNGAELSTGYLRIIKKAPQRLPRKSKKAQPEVVEAPVAPATTQESAVEVESVEETESVTAEVKEAEVAEPVVETAQEETEVMPTADEVTENDTASSEAKITTDNNEEQVAVESPVEATENAAESDSEETK